MLSFLLSAMVTGIVAQAAVVAKSMWRNA